MKHLPAASRRLASILGTLALMLVLSPAALADTDGTEPQITRQPDQLVLQLGVRWAGVEFELRTDAGIFPAPVVVDESGVLTMDLGGSSTYTLSCIESAVPIPSPDTQQPDPQDDAAAPSADPVPQAPSEPAPAAAMIPAPHLVILLVGLAAGGAGLTLFLISRRRQNAYYDEWDDEEPT